MMARGEGGLFGASATASSSPFFWLSLEEERACQQGKRIDKSAAEQVENWEEEEEGERHLNIKEGEQLNHRALLRRGFG